MDLLAFSRRQLRHLCFFSAFLLNVLSSFRERSGRRPAARERSPCSSYIHQVCLYQYILRCWIMNKMHPQLRSARLYIAQQHSAAQCGAVPCPSVRGAVLCGAVRSFEHIAVVVPRMIQVQGSCTRCVLVFLLSSVDCPLSVSMPPPPNSIRTAVQNVT